MIAARRIELTAVGMSRRLAGKSCLELLIETEFHICSWRRSTADLRHNKSQTWRAGSPDLVPPEKSSSAALKEMRHSSISFVTTGRYERQLSNRFPCSGGFAGRAFGSRGGRHDRGMNIGMAGVFAGRPAAGVARKYDRMELVGP